MYISNLHNVERLLHDSTEVFLNTAGQYVQDRAREQAPKDTGNLIQSIQHHLQMKAIASGEVRIGTNLPYGLYQERGTGIYALDGGRLTPWTYKIPGSNEFRRTRGTKPKRFVEKAGKQSEPAVEAMAKHIFGQMGS